MASLHRRVGSELMTLRQTLKAFDRSLRRLTPLLSAGASLNGSANDNGRSRPRLSAKARASMVLQGRYMGYMRQLKPRQKAQVREVRDAKGIAVAISRAKELARSRRRLQS
ncbi:MAG TPA: hypothetical protein VGV60_10880 [Candidatus Polarisedimenticolia bacterium]|nr:hypothetical protein [Candidatus Polarisedimenticolia bacterium]